MSRTIRVEVRHNTMAIAMADLCRKAGLRGVVFDSPDGPVRGEADEEAMVKLRRTKFIREIVEEGAKG